MIPETITIRTGWLIDGSGSEAVKDCLIEFSEEKISSIIKITPETEIPPGCIIYSDCTVIPGLIDSHTHLNMSGSLDQKIRGTQILDGYNDAEPRIEKHLNDYLKHGIVAVRDGGDFHANVLRYKNEYHSKNEAPVTIYAAGTGYHVKGRYGQLLGMPLEPGRKLAQAILEDFKPGIDHIKIINSGLNSLAKFGRETSPQFSKEELRMAVEAAESMGLKVMVHANGRLPVKLSIESGCHSIEHGFFMGEDNLKRMADNGVVWVPTACTMKAYMEECSDPETQYYHVAENNLFHQLDQIETAIKYGVTVALGTDAGSPGVYHGYSVINELMLLVKAGYSVEEAIKCATSNAMKIIGDGSNKRPISKGMPSTFLIVKGKPVNLPDSLKDIKGVWVNGCRI